MVPTRWRMLALTLPLLCVPVVYAQDIPGRLTFEVASIRPANPEARNGFIRALPGGYGYAAQNMSVKVMISLMYKVPMRQINGGPEWLATARYDVEAKADKAYNLDDLHTMFQNLLADRFKLKFHKEIKQGPVYALSVDKSGLKMRINGSGEDMKIPINRGQNNEFIGVKVPMRYFCWWLTQQLQRNDRPVIDETGLKDSYDFTLAFAPELPPDVPKESLPPELLDRPSIFDAVRDQLGLKLTPQNGPVEHYVIDHVERPSDN